jgi:hypothetical protein
MWQMINGIRIDVSADADGAIDASALYQAAGVSPSRQLVLQLPDGRNLIVNPGQRLRVNPNQCFANIPVHERGT